MVEKKSDDAIKSITRSFNIAWNIVSKFDLILMI